MAKYLHIQFYCKTVWIVSTWTLLLVKHTELLFLAEMRRNDPKRCTPAAAAASYEISSLHRAWQDLVGIMCYYNLLACMTFNHYYMTVKNNRKTLTKRVSGQGTCISLLSWLLLIFTRWWPSLMFYNNKLHNVWLTWEEMDKSKTFVCVSERTTSVNPVKSFPHAIVHLYLLCWRICVGTEGG